MTYTQFWALTLEEARRLYTLKILDATSYLLAIIKTHGAAGWRWSFKVDDFCQYWGIPRRTFYWALSKLRASRLVFWEASDKVTVWWHDIYSDVSNLDPVSTVQDVAQSVQDVAQSVQDVAQSVQDVAQQSLKAPENKAFQEFPKFSSEFSSNSFSNEQQQDPAAAQEKKVQEPELNTAKKDVAGLRLPQKTCDEFQEKLEIAVRQLQEVKCTPAIEINQTVLSALRSHLNHVDDAILYLRECIRTWDSYKGTHHNWTGVFVKALKEGQKPRFLSGSTSIASNSAAAVPLSQTAEIHPLLQAGLESGEISELDPIYKGLWDADRNWHKQADWLALRENEVKDS
jgi:hypothetical protein